MPPNTPVLHWVARRGLPVGLAMLLVFGVSGWLLDSTALGVFAGIGFALAAAALAARGG